MVVNSSLLWIQWFSERFRSNRLCIQWSKIILFGLFLWQEFWKPVSSKLSGNRLLFILLLCLQMIFLFFQPLIVNYYCLILLDFSALKVINVLIIFLLSPYKIHLLIACLLCNNVPPKSVFYYIFYQYWIVSFPNKCLIQYNRAWSDSDFI